MMNKKGWVRLGVVFSGLWTFGVLSVASYELNTFPIEMRGYEMRAPTLEKNYFFIEVGEAWLSEQDPDLIAFFKKQGVAEHAIPSEVYVSRMNPLFYAALLFGLFGFWIIGHAAPFVYEWVRDGFK